MLWDCAQKTQQRGFNLGEPNIRVVKCPGCLVSSIIQILGQNLPALKAAARVFEPVFVAAQGLLQPCPWSRELGSVQGASLLCAAVQRD